MASRDPREASEVLREAWRRYAGARSGSGGEDVPGLDGRPFRDVIDRVRFEVGRIAPRPTDMAEVALVAAWETYADWEARHMVAFAGGRTMPFDPALPGMADFGGYVSRAEDRGIVEFVMGDGDLAWRVTPAGAALVARPEAGEVDVLSVARANRRAELRETVLALAWLPVVAPAFLALYLLEGWRRRGARRRGGRLA